MFLLELSIIIQDRVGDKGPIWVSLIILSKPNKQHDNKKIRIRQTADQANLESVSLTKMKINWSHNKPATLNWILYN